MMTRQRIEAQLKRLGVTVKNWGAAELNELPHILTDDESIMAYVHGWYDNGFATLLATSDRLLLIDKKLFNLTIEDIGYDMIAEVDYNARLVDATIRVNTVNKCLRFTSMRHRQLRELTRYVQQRVMESRQQPYLSQQFDHRQGRTPAAEDRHTAPVTYLIPQPATPTLPIQPPQLSPMRRMTPTNRFAKPSLTTRHIFLPKVPRRWRPS